MFEIALDENDFAQETLKLNAAYSQMPFAISMALNDALFDAKQVLTDSTWPRSVHVRNARFLDWALHIEKADKHTLRGAIYDSTPDQRAHLALHADGGTKLPKAGHLAIPTKAVARTGSGAVVINQRPATMQRKVVKGQAIFQEQGRGKNRKLVLMYSLKRSAQIKKDVPFRQDFDEAIKEAAMRHFPNAMRYAMRTAR